MKISVIVVTYNEENTLEKTLQSIVSQVNFDKYVELIVIDGASTDGTVEIIKKYSKYITKWVSEPDKGIYDAMNKGIKMATGDFVYFLNAADQFFDKNVIKNVIKKIGNDKNSIFYGDVWRYDFETGKIINKRKIYKDEKGNLNFKFAMPLSHQSVFIPTKYAAERLYDLNFSIMADYKQLYSFFHSNYKFKYTSLNISMFDINGISSNKRIQLAIEGLFIVMKYAGFETAMISSYWHTLKDQYIKQNNQELINCKHKIRKLKSISIWHLLKKYKFYKDLTDYVE